METVSFSTDFLCKIEFSQRGSASCLKMFHLDLPCFCCKCMSRLLCFGTSRTSRNVRLESAKWAKADFDQVAVRDFMSTALDQSADSCVDVCIPACGRAVGC